jgi:small GTP-binding protein
MIEFRDNSIKLQIWDSAGQERYKALIPSYVRGAAIVFIIYDISDQKSFINVENWINFIKQVNTDESLLVLCGNKNDLERQVNYKEGFELAQKNGMLFFETSAKNRNNIDLMMFTTIAQLPFFSQFQIDKDELIKELQTLNSKFGNIIEEKNEDLQIREDDNNNNAQPTKILIRKKKKNCAC